jgi:hypothetical protein
MHMWLVQQYNHGQDWQLSQEQNRMKLTPLATNTLPMGS